MPEREGTHGWPKADKVGLHRVREGDAYPAGLKGYAQVRPGDPYSVPLQPGAPDDGRAEFVLEIRGSFIDSDSARQAIRKAVQEALRPDGAPSVLVREATVLVTSVVMR